MRERKAMGHGNKTGETVRLTAVVHGRVQGVGFRYRTARMALELSLAGAAANNPDGTVGVIAEGTPEAVGLLLDWLQSPGAPGTVSAVDADIGPAAGGLHGFQTE